MKKIIQESLIALFAIFTLTNCNSTPAPVEQVSGDMDATTHAASTSVAEAKYNGNYKGVQPAYNLQNQYGEDILVSGNPIVIPSINYKIELSGRNSVTMIHTKDGESFKDIYRGSYSINESAENKISLDCEVRHETETSNPSFTLIVDMENRMLTYVNKGEPSFNLNRMD
jgi:hypothetical protein